MRSKNSTQNNFFMTHSVEPIIVVEKFNASNQEVWKAISDVEEMTKWFFPNIAAFEPKVGFETRFVIQNEDRIFPHLWKVTEVVPLKKLAYEWVFEGYEGRGISLFELTETNQKTTLQLTFTVIEPFPDHIPEFKRESGVQGWNYFIKESLKNYLESKNSEI